MPRKKAAKKKTRKTRTSKKAGSRRKTSARKKTAARRKKTAARKKTNAAKTLLPVEGIEPYKLKRGEKYMNDDQVEHFRKLLMAWKSELMQEVDQTIDHMKDEAANFPDPSDRATQESEFSLELRTRDRERKLIRKIDEGLRQLEAAEYGYCESCGVEIGIRRLEARPTATLCIDCKTLDEIRERQTG